MLAPERGADRRASLDEDESDGPPARCVPGAATGVMNVHALARIAGVPGVQGAVGAPDDVDEVHADDCRCGRVYRWRDCRPKSLVLRWGFVQRCAS